MHSNKAHLAHLVLRYYISLPFFAFDYLRLPSFLAISALFASTVNSPHFQTHPFGGWVCCLSQTAPKTIVAFGHLAIISSTKPTGEKQRRLENSQLKENHIWYAW